MGKYVYDSGSYRRPNMAERKAMRDEPQARGLSVSTPQSRGVNPQDDSEFRQANNDLARVMGRQSPYQTLTDGAASTRGKAGQAIPVSPQATPAKNTLQRNPQYTSQDINSVRQMSSILSHLEQNPKDTQSMDRWIKLYNDSGLSSRGDAFAGSMTPEGLILYDEQSNPLQGRITSSEMGNMNNYFSQVENPEYTQNQQQAPRELNKDMASVLNAQKTQYRTDTKSAKSTIKAYEDMANLAKPRKDGSYSGINDVSLIFKFMKALDPQSTVRESEFNTVANAGGLPTMAQRYYNQLTNGTLPDDIRNQMVDSARQLANSSVESVNQRRQFQDRTNQDIGLTTDVYDRTKTYSPYGAEQQDSQATMGGLTPEESAELAKLRALDQAAQSQTTAPRVGHSRGGVAR